MSKSSEQPEINWAELSVEQHIDALTDVNQKLRESGQKLEQALDLIDVALMDPEKVEKDTAAVGGPVSMYSMDYDEEAVVERVVQRITDLTNQVITLKGAFKVADKSQKFRQNKIKRLETAICTFVEKSRGSAMCWRKQPHIAELYTIAEEYEKSLEANDET